MAREFFTLTKITEFLNHSIYLQQVNVKHELTTQ